MCFEKSRHSKLLESKALSILMVFPSAEVCNESEEWTFGSTKRAEESTPVPLLSRRECWWSLTVLRYPRAPSQLQTVWLFPEIGIGCGNCVSSKAWNETFLWPF